MLNPALEMGLCPDPTRSLDYFNTIGAQVAVEQGPSILASESQMCTYENLMALKTYGSSQEALVIYIDIL